MMTRRTPLLLATCACALLGAACGDLSQEDLLFRASLPSKSEVELRPAGSVSEADASDSTAAQALDAPCADGDLRCASQEQAKGFNQLTFGLLDVIDNVTAQPPTEREPGKRVWGPFFIADKGFTARFQMQRLPDASGGVQYTFCMHAAQGRIAERQAKDVTCDTDVDDDTGLARILSGTFTPGQISGERARSGKGEMTFEVARVPEFPPIGRSLGITFDNEEGRTDITVVVNGAERADGSTTQPLTYGFTREADGSGTFDLVIVANIAQQTRRLEELHIQTAWNADQAGRANASVTGGDVGAGGSETQCWDSAGVNTFVQVSGLGPDQQQQQGDEGQCVFDADFNPR